MILKTSSMGKRPVYYVQKSYRNEDGKPSTKYVETDRRTWPTHGLGKWEVPAGYKFSRQRGRRRRQEGRTEQRGVSSAAAA